MKRALLLAVLLSVALAACDKQKDVEPPAELVDFKATLAVMRLWSTSAGGGDDVLRLALAPAVSGAAAYIAGQGGEVAALQLGNGRSIWRTSLELPLGAGPGLGEGLVAVGALDGMVIALDATSGAERWRAAVGGEVLAAPVIGRGRVIVHTVDGRIQALNSTDGSSLWTYEQLVPRLSLRGSAAPVIDGDTVFAAFDNGKVAALSVADGELLWNATISPARGRTELERLVDIDASVRVAGEDVFVAGYQGRAAMLARGSGQIWWARDLSTYRGLALGRDALYISTADSAVVALSRRDGTELWRQEAMLRRGLTAPAYTADALVVADFEGYVHWLDAATGALLARSSAGGERVVNAPVVADGLVLVQTEGGRVTAFRAEPRD